MDLWKLDATAQAALVRARDVSPEELLDAAIARIERLNPHVNAVTIPMFERARAAARNVPLDAPFAGVPMLVKDACIEIEGTPYTLGTKLLRAAGYVSPHTTELARRLMRAGFIFAGKTNTPELSAGVTTEPQASGAARNPWDPARSTSGSSGGSAAAVACGMTSIAHGGDGTGSLRYPAAACGVATLKPSRGRIPQVTPAGQPDPLGVWTEFVLARSVRDLAGVLDAVHGAPPGARWDAPPPALPYAESSARAPRRLRVGVLLRDVMTGMQVDEACVDAVRATGETLSELGHEVKASHPPALDGVLLRIMPAMAAWGSVARAAQLRWLAQSAGRELREGDLDPEHFAAAHAAQQISEAQVRDACETIAREMAPMHDWFVDHDVLLTPALRQPAWPLGMTGGARDAGVFPPPFSFSGQPAAVVPAAWTPDGLPIGVQIVGGYGRDDVVLQVMAQIEASRPWASRWPAICE